MRSKTETPTKSPVVHFIEPTAVYDLHAAREAVGVAKGCLPREIRLGRLRVSKRGGKYLILGAWLLEWVEAGEIARRKSRPEALEAENAADN